MAVEHLSTEELLSIKNANGNFSHLPTDTLQRFAHPAGQPYVQHSFNEGVTPETPFETAANAGKFVAGGIQQAMPNMGPKLGAAVGSIPQSPTAVALSPLMATGGGSEGAQALDTAGAQGGMALEGAGQAPTRVVRPGMAAKLAGEATQVTARIPSRFGSAVFADPSILHESTPSVADVSKKMGNYFAEKGVNINSQELQKISGKGYIPNDNQVEELRNRLLQPVLDKIEAVANKVPGAVAPSEEEIIFAERAANAMTRSTGAQQNKYLMSFASGARNALMDQLEKSGFNKLPGLKAEYFRALAKEAFNDFMPQNKTGGPNALSGLLMGKSALGALGSAAQGDVPGAIGGALKTASFSPLLIGQGIRAANAIPNMPLGPLGIAAQQGLNRAEPPTP